MLKKALHDTLLDDGGVFLAKTGSIVKGSSLRGKVNRRKFSEIIMSFDGEDLSGTSKRFWTKRLFKDTLSELVTEYQLELPRIPGFDMDGWLEDQAKLLQSLAKKARRNKGYRPSSCSSLTSSMADDAQQTIPYELEDRF